MSLPDRLRAFGPDRRRPLSMITAYDATFAAIAVESGVDALLVGDSLANVMLGFPRTASVGIAEMVHHARAVRRGAPDATVVVDLPSGSEATPELALEHSRMLIEAGADAVKLEGCFEAVVSNLTESGIAVMGHLGLLPQTAVSLRQVGRTPQEKARLLDEAHRIERAGAFAVVLEHIPAALGEEVTARLGIPTIGIGAGPGCAGQVLVLHDLLGLSSRQPPFARARVDLRGAARAALAGWHADVAAGRFPPPAEPAG